MLQSFITEMFHKGNASQVKFCTAEVLRQCNVDLYKGVVLDEEIGELLTPHNYVANQTHKCSI